MANTASGSSRGSAPLDSQGVSNTSLIRAQTAVIYDLLSEGPIEGLVDGVASIRLNDNPVEVMVPVSLSISLIIGPVGLYKATSSLISLPAEPSTPSIKL